MMFRYMAVYSLFEASLLYSYRVCAQNIISFIGMNGGWGGGQLNELLNLPLVFASWLLNSGQNYHQR